MTDSKTAQTGAAQSDHTDQPGSQMTLDSAFNKTPTRYCGSIYCGRSTRVGIADTPWGSRALCGRCRRRLEMEGKL